MTYLIPETRTKVWTARVVTPAQKGHSVSRRPDQSLDRRKEVDNVRSGFAAAHIIFLFYRRSRARSGLCPEVYLLAAAVQTLVQTPGATMTYLIRLLDVTWGRSYTKVALECIGV